MERHGVCRRQQVWDRVRLYTQPRTAYKPVKILRAFPIYVLPELCHIL